MWLLNSQERSSSKFSLQYQYIVKQTGDENKENHQLGDERLDVPLNSHNGERQLHELKKYIKIMFRFATKITEKFVV